MKDVRALWDALLAGEPEHDESVVITSADVNQQTADRISELSKTDQDNQVKRSQRFWNFLCDRGVHFWKRIPTSMIDPFPWRHECRNCGAMPKPKNSW